MEDAIGQVFVALIHYPVLNRNGQVIKTAITNFDIHDIARSAKTYGVSGLFIVTPDEQQQMLAQKIIGHWKEGFGAKYNPTRRDALDLVRVTSSLGEVVEDVKTQVGQEPALVLTDAKRFETSVEYDEIRDLTQKDRPVVILFGTGWGASLELIEQSDYILAPIEGVGSYNHLSVRSAAAIILDRLLGARL